jgi:hypothetical protein
MVQSQMTDIPTSSPGQASFSIEKWQPMRSGKLYGFVTVRIGGLRIDGIKICRAPPGPPATARSTQEARKKHSAPGVEFVDKAHAKRFGEALIRRFENTQPNLYSAKADVTVTLFPAGVQRRTDETRNFAQR